MIIILIIIGAIIVGCIILAIIRIKKFQVMLNKEIIDYSILAKEKGKGDGAR